jgi:uncharacterized protein
MRIEGLTQVPKHQEEATRDFVMKIGVLSDTHGETGATERAIRILHQQHVGLAIHCGDVGSDIVPLLKGLPTHFVYGNVDELDPLHEAMVDSEHTLHRELGSLEIEGRRVAFLHGHDVKLLRHTIHSGGYDLVCHGHTHAFSHTIEGKTVVLNPGAVARTTHPSVAIVAMPSLEVTEIAL